MLTEITLPSWTDQLRISVFAGNELVAQRDVISIFNPITKKHEMHVQPFKIKVGRCCGCGDCCGEGGSPFPPKMLEEVKQRLKDYEYSKHTPCPFLADDGCILKGKILFSCASSNCEGWSKNCTEVLK